MWYFILVIKQREKVGRPTRNPYQVARTQRAAASIDDFLQKFKIDRSAVIDLMLTYEAEHDEHVTAKEKQNLRVWFNNMREGKIAKPNKKTIFDLCKVLGKLEDPVRGEDDPFLIYLTLSCRLHFTPFQPLHYGNIEFRGTDWYQAIKNDPDFPDYFEFIYDFIEPEDIAIDMAELLYEPIEKWIEAIHSFDYDLWKFYRKMGRKPFYNKDNPRPGNMAYFILVDWLIYHDCSMKKWRLNPSEKWSGLFR